MHLYPVRPVLPEFFCLDSSSSSTSVAMSETEDTASTSMLKPFLSRSYSSLGDAYYALMACRPSPDRVVDGRTEEEMDALIEELVRAEMAKLGPRVPDTLLLPEGEWF